MLAAGFSSEIRRFTMTNEQSVFVVDEDSAVHEMVAKMAKSMGVTAEGYRSAENFLARRDRTRAGCLVLDICLDGMSGLELLDVMRRDELCLQTIVLTAFADVPLTVRVMQCGAVTVLEKPYRVQELRDAIRRALVLDVQSRQNGGRAVEVRVQLASLTPDERGVLELILIGKTNKAISQKLSLRLRTVESRRQSLMVKIKVTSLAELVQVVTEARTLHSMQVARERLSTAAGPYRHEDPHPFRNRMESATAIGSDDEQRPHSSAGDGRLIQEEARVFKNGQL
jgi:two-component system response regulator FixJ